MSKKLNYIDLFAGAGGLSEGFVRAGFNPVAHVEMDVAACFSLRTRTAYHYLKENKKLDRYIEYDIQENVLLRKRVRTDDLASILKEIIDVYKTGITAFLRPNGIIDKKLGEIFWGNLSQDLGVWINKNDHNSLLRYIVSHFQESLDIDSLGDFEEYYPIEVYIKPPIKKNIHTGDLIQINSDVFLVLTPACDIVFNYKLNDKGEKLAFRKADKMMLIAAKDFDYKNLCLNKTGKVEKSKIKEYVSNGTYRYHYLPPFNGNNGFLIDFQEIKSESFETQHTRIATISPPFIKDIISRFANYYSRQGQPTFGQEAIINNLYESVQ